METEIDAFMKQPVVRWDIYRKRGGNLQKKVWDKIDFFICCFDVALPIYFSLMDSFLKASEKKGLTYEILVDGLLIHDVFSDIISKVNNKTAIKLTHYLHTGLVPSNGDPNLRFRNLAKLLDNLRSFYELHDSLFVYFIMKMPNINNLSREPRQHCKEAQKLLFLLLGCWQWAISKNKEFIDVWVNNVCITTQASILDYLNEISEIEKNYELLQSKHLQRVICDFHRNDEGLLEMSEDLSKQFLIDVFKIRLGEVESEKIMLAQKKDELEDQVKSIKNKNDTLKNKLMDLNKQLTSLTEKSAQNFEKTRIMLEEEYNLKLTASTNEVAKLKEDLKNLQENNVTLKAEYHKTKFELESVLARHQQELNDQTGKMIELEAELIERCQNYDALSKMNRTLEQERERLTTKNCHLMSQMHDYENVTIGESSMSEEKKKKTPSSSSKKKKGSSLLRSSIFGKATEFLSRSRRSLAEATPVAELSNEFEYRRSYDSRHSLGVTRSPRECSVSDIGLSSTASANKPRSRKSLDFLDDLNSSEFAFDSGEKKSGTLTSLNKDEGEDDDLNRTLTENNEDAEENDKDKLDPKNQWYGPTTSI